MSVQFIQGKKVVVENPEGADFDTVISAIQTTSQGQLDLKKISFEKRKEIITKFTSHDRLVTFYRDFCLTSGIQEKTIQQEIKHFQEKTSALVSDASLSRPPLGPCLIYGSRSSVLLRMVTVLTALLRGNSVLLLFNKEKTDAYFELTQQLLNAGLPEKALNLISTHSAESLETLIDHPALKAIHFTGNNYESSFLKSRPLPLFSKKIKIHCGGRNPTLFTYDADLTDLKDFLSLAFNEDFLAEHRFNRWFVQDKNYDSFIAELNSLLEEDNLLGSKQKIEDTAYNSYLQTQNISLLKEKNWKRIEEKNISVNYDFNNCSPWHQQETLGSFLTVTRYKNSAEAIKFANTTNYASAATVVTSDANKSKEIASQLNMPHIFCNRVPDIASLPLIHGAYGCGFGNDVSDFDFFVY